jgi:hypothetical protein
MESTCHHCGACRRYRKELTEMVPDHPHPTPQEAREQLSASQPRRLTTRRDRTTHAVATATFGLALGVFSAAQNLAVSWVGEALLTAAFVLVVVGTASWVERAARTVPRRSRLWSRIGLGLSFVLSLLLVRPWLNLQAQTEPNTWPMVLGAAVAIALPSLVAAAVIARRRE